MMKKICALQAPPSPRFHTAIAPETRLNGIIQTCKSQVPLSIAAADSLLTTVKTDLDSRMAMDSGHPYLTTRQAELQSISESVASGEIQLIGVVGWGEGCLRPDGIDPIEKRQGISQHHGILFIKNGQTFFESFGTAITVRNKKPLTEKIKTADHFVYTHEPAVHPPEPICERGEVVAISDDRPILWGCYTTEKGDKTRYVQEAPLDHIWIFQTCVLKDGRKQQMKALGALSEQIGKMHPRKGYWLAQASTEYDDDDDNGYYRLTTISVGAGSQAEIEADLTAAIGAGYTLDHHAFQPTEMALVSNVMCNAACAPQARAAALKALPEGSDCGVVYVTHPGLRTSEDTVNKTQATAQKEARLYITQGEIGRLALSKESGDEFPIKGICTA